MVGRKNPEWVTTRSCADLTDSSLSLAAALLGDTLHHPEHPTEALASFKPLQQMVYAGFYPTEPAQYLKLDESVHRLALTDRAVSVNRESSAALGQGLRLGFLGGSLKSLTVFVHVGE